MSEINWPESSVELTEEEKYFLNRARQTSTAHLALEHYARLFDSLDARLGKGNEPARFFADEYIKRTGYRPEEGGIVQDSRDRERIELMEASFLWQRLYPPEVGKALTFHTLQKYIPGLQKSDKK